MTTKKYVVRVRSRKDRFGFDGQTGCLVLAGTMGTVYDMRLTPALSENRLTKAIETTVPKLTVFWDTTLLQDAANDDFDVTTSWEEPDVKTEDVEFVEAAIRRD